MADVHKIPGVPDDPARFEEAIRAFRRRTPVTDDVWDAMVETEREFAFTLANVTQADLVTEVYEAIERAVEHGTTLEEFKAAVAPAIEEAWGGEEPGRIDTIFRTNVQGAYNAGRYERMTSPAARRARPFWMLDAITDSRTTDGCRLADGTVLDQDHAWWRTNYPPRHFQCRSVATPLTHEEAEAEGITSSPPAVHADPGFGKPPSTTGQDWAPEPREDYPPAIAGVLEDKLADAD